MRYTYVVQANKEGKFSIPSAQVVVDKKTYKSNPVNIEVVIGGHQQQTNRPTATQAGTVTKITKDYITIKPKGEKRSRKIGLFNDFPLNPCK